MCQEITLKYGEGVQSFSLPQNFRHETLTPKEPNSNLSEKEIIDIRLNNPFASDKLEDILKSQDKILIVVPDKTRVVRLDLIFPYLLSIFEKKGISHPQISIIFASGSHHGMSDEEKIDILGVANFRSFANYIHDCRESWCDNYGETSRGTPILLNHLIKTHTKIIVISSVVHHYFAGFGGGPKMIVPGLANYETIWNNHKLMVDAEETPLHPACQPGNIVGNPVHEDLTEAVKKVKVDFTFQLVLNQKNRLVDMFCGDLFSCFQKASMKVHQLNAAPVSQQADLVIASAGGFPKDLNLVQAHKSIHHAVRALKPGGNLIVLAECGDGLGNPSLINWFEFGSYREMKNAVMRKYELNANTALVLKYKLENYNIHLKSKLPDNVVKKMGFIPFDDLNDLLKDLTPQVNHNPFVFVMPNASLTLPVFK